MGRLLEQPTQTQMEDQATRDAEKAWPLSRERRQQIAAILDRAITPSGTRTFSRKAKGE